MGIKSNIFTGAILSVSMQTALAQNQPPVADAGPDWYRKAQEAGLVCFPVYWWPGESTSALTI